MSNELKTHKDLMVWKRSMQLAKDIYQITKSFSKEERYGLISQMRIAAVSVPSNIAEGAARASQREFVQFLYIALGSLSELETQWLLAKDMDLAANSPDKTIDPIRKMLLGLIRSLKNK